MRGIQRPVQLLTRDFSRGGRRYADYPVGPSQLPWTSYGSSKRSGRIRRALLVSGPVTRPV